MAAKVILAAIWSTIVNTTMHHLHISETITGDTITLTDTEQLHHLRDVLRLKTGDEVTVFGREGDGYVCAIAAVDRGQAVLEIRARMKARRSTVKVTVACAIPGKSRMDDIVDTLTQLGVDHIIPMVTGRVIVKLDETGSEKRLERWRRIARSAAEQSQRSTIPDIEPVTGLGDLLSRAADFDLKLVPTLYGERRHLREVLAGAKPGSVLVLIGPEGDFTPGEVEQAQKAGFVAVTLGDTVLRVATAAAAVASYIRLS